MAKRIGLSDAAIERVAAGEVVSEELEASSDKDLSLALVALLDASVAHVNELVDEDAFKNVSTVTLSRGRIDPATFSLDDMKLPDDALDALVSHPAKTFFLAEAEAAKIEKAAAKGRNAALAAYRDVLSQRARTYWENGIAGIAPYAGKGRSPKQDLAHANEAARAVIERKDLQALLTTIPTRATDDAEHILEWRVEKGRDMAAPVLSHVIRYRSDDGLLFVERRFYSGYDYDALQALFGVLPTPKGDRSVFFYVNHTYTAQVAGFGGGAKRSIGRKIMEKALVAEVDRIQKDAGKP